MQQYLLDTHTLIWFIDGVTQLPKLHGCQLKEIMLSIM